MSIFGRACKPARNYDLTVSTQLYRYVCYFDEMPNRRLVPDSYSRHHIRFTANLMPYLCQLPINIFAKTSLPTVPPHQPSTASTKSKSTNKNTSNVRTDTKTGMIQSIFGLSPESGFLQGKEGHFYRLIVVYLNSCFSELCGVSPDL